MTMTSPRNTTGAPHGRELSAKNWQTEGALRMLMNNLDPEFAERPEDLVVYGGTGRAARSWAAYDAIVATMRDLEVMRHVDARYERAVEVTREGGLRLPMFDA